MKPAQRLRTFAFLCVCLPAWAASASELPTSPSDEVAHQEVAEDPSVILADADSADRSASEGNEAGKQSAPASSVEGSTQQANEVRDICDATCAGAFDIPACNQSCAEETSFCFARCEELSSNKNDCFLSCTQIAVDYGQRWDEAEMERIAHEMAEEPAPRGRKFAFGMNAIGGLHYVPKFALNALLDMSIPHWRDQPKYFYGGEFVFRFDDRNDFLIGVDYSDFRTPDGWWLEKNDPATSVDWVENNLRAITITLGWNGIANLGTKKRAHFYGGLGLGAAIRLGDFKKAELTVGCVDDDQALSYFSTVTPDSYCPNLPSQQMLLNRTPSGEITEWEIEKIPPVLPSLVITAGFRYIIADTISLAVEGGFKTAAFYGGLKVGFIVGRTHAQAARAQARNAAPVAVTP